MKRSNLYITLSDGSKLFAVADSKSAPEQGYIVEQLLQPLLAINNATKEKELLKEHCCINQLRPNARYDYFIDLQLKEVRFYAVKFDCKSDIFIVLNDLTDSYHAYLKKIADKG
jgi:hypothetical protein